MYNDYPTIYETNINQYIIYYIILAVIIIAIFVFTMISLAKIFKKANRSGISAIIPLYNFIVLLEITNLPTWYFILLLIPGVNIVFNVFIMMELARLFRKSKAFGLGLTFLPFIFYPILAFSNSEYIGINLVAKEQKSTVVEVPKVVNEEENPVVNESFDDKNKNINISIGGGVYQKDYTSTLLNLDQKQVIVDKTSNVVDPVVDNIEKNNTFISSMPEETKVNNNDDGFKDIATTISQVPVIDNLSSNNNQSYIELVTNDVPHIEETPVINNQVMSNNQSDIDIIQPKVNKQVSEFVDCPQCGAKVKASAGVCFLCGKTLD